MRIVPTSTAPPTTASIVWLTARCASQTESERSRFSLEMVNSRPTMASGVTSKAIQNGSARPAEPCSCTSPPWEICTMPEGSSTMVVVAWTSPER